MDAKCLQESIDIGPGRHLGRQGIPESPQDAKKEVPSQGIKKELRGLCEIPKTSPKTYAYNVL
jgi:hypothetical protein